MSGGGYALRTVKLPAGHYAVLDSWTESASDRFPDEGETSIDAYFYGPDSEEPVVGRHIGLYPRGYIDEDHVIARFNTIVAQWRVKAHARAGSRGVRTYWSQRHAEQARLRRGAKRLGRQVERHMEH